PQAFQVILDSGVPVVLAPWEVSSKIWLMHADLEQLVTSNPSLEWLTRPASDMMIFWKLAFGVYGIRPLDTLALGYALTPDLCHCEALPAKTERLPNDVITGHTPAQKPYLLAAKEIDGGRVVQYCGEVQPRFKMDLMTRLAREPAKI